MMLGRTAAVVTMVSSLAAGAATITARTCSRADVGAAVDQASAGDEVVIPEGTCTWQVTLVIGTSISLRGANRATTVLRDDVSKTNADYRATPLILVEASRVRLFEFTVEGVAPDPNNNNQGHVVFGGDLRDVRADHLTFRSVNNSSLAFGGRVTGVVDHCSFDLRSEQGILLYHDEWDGGAFGDSSWASPSTMGTDQALFVEDCDFIDRAATGAGAVVALGGARVVVRNNLVVSDGVYGVGTDSSGRFRSVRHLEVYGNRFTTQSQFTAIELGGGTGVVFDNSFEGAFQQPIRLTVGRALSANSVFGRCNGSSAYDQNAGASGYACLDQVGRGEGELLSGFSPALPGAWPRQVLDPVYLWRNSTDAGVPLITVVTPSVIRLGTDYLDGTPRPRYQPFAYPHPLTTTALADAGPGPRDAGDLVSADGGAGRLSWRVVSCDSSSTGGPGLVLGAWWVAALISRKARRPALHRGASWPKT
jgi:hypothetical protein